MAESFFKDLESIKKTFCDSLLELKAVKAENEKAKKRIEQLECEVSRLTNLLDSQEDDGAPPCTCRRSIWVNSSESFLDETCCSAASASDVVPESPTAKNDFKPLRDLRERSNKQTSLNTFFSPPTKRGKWRKVKLNRRPLDDKPVGKENSSHNSTLDSFVNLIKTDIKVEKDAFYDADDLQTQINETILAKIPCSTVKKIKKEETEVNKLIKIKKEPQSQSDETEYDLDCTQCSLIYKFRNEPITKEILEKHKITCETYKRKMEDIPGTPDGFWDVDFQNPAGDTLIDYRRIEE